MKLKSKLFATFVALILAGGALVGCGQQPQPEPEKYKVILPVGAQDYTIAGINSEGYIAGANVSFTVTVTNEDKEINTVKYDNTVLTATTPGAYAFVMPEKDVTLAVTLKDVKKYALSITPEVLKVDGQVEAELVLGTDPVARFTLSAKAGAEHVAIEDKIVKGLSEGDVTLAATVDNKEVATLNLTVAKSEIMSIADALDEAIVEAPCNAKTGKNANMSSPKLVHGKVIAISNGKGQTSVNVIIDDGTAALVLMVGKNANDPAPVAVGDVFKVETVLTNYYGLFEGIAADASTGGSAGYLAADDLVAMEKDITPSLNAPVAMSAEEYKAYYDAAAINGAASGDNRTYTEIKYATITGTCKEVSGKSDSGIVYEVSEGLYLDADMTPEGVVTAQVGKTSTFDAFLIGINSQKTKSNIIATAQRAKAIETLTISETTKSLLKNNSFTLTYTVAPADSWGVESWESSDKTVAKVDEKGVVTAQNKGGEATITLTVGDKTATCAVTVSAEDVPATAAVLNKTELALEFPGEAETLVATPTPNPTTDVAQWSSSDATVAKVEDGKVTPLKVGTATITVKYNDNVSATCAVTVTAKHGTVKTDPLTVDEAYAVSELVKENNKDDGITYFIKAVIVSVGSFNTQYKNIDVNAQTTDGKVFILYRLSKYIDAEGAAKSLTAEEAAKLVVGAEIVAAAKITKYNTTHETVSSGVIHSIDATQIRYVGITAADGKSSVDVGKTLQLTAKAYPEAVGSEATFAWASSSTAIATVSDAGVVTGVAEGKVTITATTGTIVGKIELDVSVALPEGAVKVEKTSLIGLKALDKDNQEATISASTTNGTQFKQIVIDDVASMSVNIDGNNGKIYGSGTEWRLYQTNNPKLKVSVADGYKILYVKVVFTISNTAILKLGDATVASGELVEIAGTPASVEFTVGNSGSATNGQIKVKGITVVYMANA